MHHSKRRELTQRATAPSGIVTAAEPLTTLTQTVLVNDGTTTFLSVRTLAIAASAQLESALSEAADITSSTTTSSTTGSSSVPTSSHPNSPASKPLDTKYTVLIVLIVCLVFVIMGMLMWIWIRRRRARDAVKGKRNARRSSPRWEKAELPGRMSIFSAYRQPPKRNSNQGQTGIHSDPIRYELEDHDDKRLPSLPALPELDGGEKTPE